MTRRQRLARDTCRWNMLGAWLPHFLKQATVPVDLATTAASRLTEEQLARALHYATPQEVAAGQVLFDIGDDSGDLVLCGTAHLEALCPSDAPDCEDIFFTYGPGQFAGELGLLTGQRRGLTIRVWPSGKGCPPCSSALSGAS
ncbi:MAG: cyclic nucleotide-binding domain-containing protein [Streptomyces sp.]